MAKGNMLLGMARKKLGDVVFYRANGEQIARARNRAPKNPKSAKQSVQRMILASASKLRQIMEPIVNHSWQNVAVGAASTRHFQSLAMKHLRAAAAAELNGESSIPVAAFSIKGAPAAGLVEVPISMGSLPRVPYSISGSDFENTPALTGIDSTFTQLSEALSEAGIQLGDQLTIIGIFAGSEVVASTSDGATNVALNARFARFTFKADDIVTSDPVDMIVNGTFNPDVLERVEGARNFNLVVKSDNITIDGGTGAPGTLVAVGLIHTHKEAGKYYYSPADLFFLDRIATSIGQSTATLVYPSYMESGTTINVGDDLYLRNAVASSKEEVNIDAYTLSVDLPAALRSGDTFTITKRGGNFTDEDFNGMIFTINGTDITANVGSSISWAADSTTYLTVGRPEGGFGASVTVNCQNGCSVEAFEY